MYYIQDVFFVVGLYPRCILCGGVISKMFSTWRGYIQDVCYVVGLYPICLLCGMVISKMSIMCYK